MTPNVGTIDRIVRVVIGLACAVLPTLTPLPGTWMVVAYLAAAFFLLTAAFAACPLYAAFGIDTRGRRRGPT